MKKFLKSKSKNQENTTRKIELNDTVDKKEKTQTIKNFSDEHKENKIEHKGNKRGKNKDNVHKIKSDKATQRKTKSIELNMGFIILKIIVIALLALLITTLTAKTVMTRIATKESSSETESEVQSIDDSSDYTITVTEYTEDTLEAECDYEENTTIVYIVDESTLEQIDCISFEDVSEPIDCDEWAENKIGYTTKQSIFYAYSCSTTSIFSDAGIYSYIDNGELTWETPMIFTSLVSEETGLYLFHVEYNQTNSGLAAKSTTSTSSYETSPAVLITGLGYTNTQIASTSIGGITEEGGYWESDELLRIYATDCETTYAWVNIIMNEYEPISYTIAFDGNGADDGEMESIEATYDEEYTLTANAFTREGYTFTGWNTEADGSGTSYEDGATVSNLTTTDGDTVTLYAQWEPITYTITFDGNDADSGKMESISATYDEEYTLTTTAFTRKGYIFTGWNTEADGSGTSYKDGATVSNLTTTDGDTVTLYAQWEPITYTIAFDGNGADEGEMESIAATYDEEYTLTTNAFTRAGYKFTGWNTEADGSGTSYEDEEKVSNLTTTYGDTVTLYAQWEKNTVSISAKVLSQEDKSTVLCGVEFSLFELICEDDSHDHTSDDDLIDVDDYDTSCWELFGTYTSDETTGEFTLEDLVLTETYRLVETRTVENYLLPSGQWNLSYATESLEVSAIGNPPAVTIETDDDGNEILYLYNGSSYDLPLTGLFGTSGFYKVGTILIVFGLCVIMIAKLRLRRRRVSARRLRKSRRRGRRGNR